MFSLSYSLSRVWMRKYAQLQDQYKVTRIDGYICMYKSLIIPRTCDGDGLLVSLLLRKRLTLKTTWEADLTKYEVALSGRKHRPLIRFVVLIGRRLVHPYTHDPPSFVLYGKVYQFFPPQYRHCTGSVRTNFNWLRPWDHACIERWIEIVWFVQLFPINREGIQSANAIFSLAQLSGGIDEHNANPASNPSPVFILAA